jgi:hypothetical protein
MTTHLRMAEVRQSAHSDEAREKRAKTIEERKRYQCEDVLLLRTRGMVPLRMSSASAFVASCLSHGSRRLRSRLHDDEQRAAPRGWPMLHGRRRNDGRRHGARQSPPVGIVADRKRVIEYWWKAA